MYYYCTFTNACGSIVDSVYINLLVANITAGNDTVICPNQIANLWANGALYYQWSPSQFVVNQTGNQVWVSPTNSTLFQVIGTDVNGCKDTAFVEVVLHPQPFIQMNPVVLAFYGDLIQLNAVANQPGVFTWSPPEFLSCINCSNPIANPDQDFTYFVNFVDENGCIAENLVSITYEAVIYVPNTFIPDGNGTNDLFGVYGGNISGMKMFIFDRWGELIHTLNSTSEFWDGTYNGNSCQDGTYTWRLIYSDKQDKKYELTGHVNLLR
jgi:gliding motility-associated-like protein